MEENKEKVELALAIEEALSKLRKLMIIVKKIGGDNKLAMHNINEACFHVEEVWEGEVFAEKEESE